MSNHLSQKELESYLWGAATLLRGLIDASDYKQYIFPLLFFKRLSDVWDEDYREAFEDSPKAMPRRPQTTASPFPKVRTGRPPAMPHAMSAGLF